MKKGNFDEKQQKGANESGAALITSIFAMLLITVLGFALISAGILAQNISTNAREQTEAYYISEAGLTHATNLLIYANTTEFNSILQAGDGIANTGDELSTRPLSLTPIPAAGIIFGNGKYVAKVGDDPADADGDPNKDSNGRIVVTSTGYGKNGATVTTESIVGIFGVPAIIVDGNVNFSGSTQLRGTMGGIHANGTLDLGGNPCADGLFSATGTIPGANKLNSGPGCSDPGFSQPFRDAVPVPSWDIRSSFYNRADYVLGAIGSKKGKVYNSSGTMIADTSLTLNKWVISIGQEFTWNPSSGLWSTSSSTLPSATYYSEGNLEITNSFGSESSPAAVTLIAEGYIELKKTSVLIPKLENYGIMAGTDLMLSTKVASGSGAQSIFYAGHQIDISGTSSIAGVLIVKNLADTNSPFCGCNRVGLSSGAIKLNANMTLTYNGGLFKNNSKIISWREVRY